MVYTGRCGWRWLRMPGGITYGLTGCRCRWCLHPRCRIVRTGQVAVPHIARSVAGSAHGSSRLCGISAPPNDSSSGWPRLAGFGNRLGSRLCCGRLLRWPNAGTCRCQEPPEDTVEPVLDPQDQSALPNCMLRTNPPSTPTHFRAYQKSPKGWHCISPHHVSVSIHYRSNSHCSWLYYPPTNTPWSCLHGRHTPTALPWVTHRPSPQGCCLPPGHSNE